jgi:hypothetical protein
MRETIRRVVLESRQRTYSYLLVVLTAYLVTSPFLPADGRLAWIDDYLLAVVLFVSLYNISGDRSHLLIGLALFLPAIAPRLVTAHLGVAPIAPLATAAISTFAFLAYLILRVMKDVLWGRRQTGERIMGAIAAYLLIGLLWSLIYGFIEFLEPGSFSIPEDMLARMEARPHDIPVSIFAYFSFVTLATLGYGDVTPIGAAARTFSSFEAVVGQLFIAITIARLVGLRVAESAMPPPGSADDDG